jgi:hypothetical protein
MSTAGTQMRPGAPPAATGFVEALRAATRRITWQSIAIATAIAVGLEIYVAFEFAFDGANPGDGEPPPAIKVYASGAIINLAMAFAIMFATRVADELVARGTKRWLAYPWAVLAGSAAGALLQWMLHQGLRLPSRYDGSGVPHDVSVMQPAVVFFEYLIWGSIAVFIYVNRRTALMASARMNLAQTEQARARRRTLESRLQALQARVEPQFLFNTLARVRTLYDEDREKGGRLLEDLIVYLRAALPHLRDSTSTFGQEVKLVTAYLNIMRAHMGDRLEFGVDASAAEAEASARVPPMILLPLVDHVLAAGAAGNGGRLSVRVAARIVSGRLVMEIGALGRVPAANDPRGPRDVLTDIRERLRALYGNLALLGDESSVALGTRIVMEMPYEPAYGDHR